MSQYIRAKYRNVTKKGIFPREHSERIQIKNTACVRYTARSHMRARDVTCHSKFSPYILQHLL